MRIISIFLVIFISGCAIYNAADRSYQNAQDPIRVKHVEVILSYIGKYVKETNKLPLSELVHENGIPFMAFIGRDDKHEEWASQQDVLKRGAGFISSKDFESILSKAIDSGVNLPVDPQVIATYAPNVYIYFEADNEFCVIAHLYSPSNKSVEYEWKGHKFYSHSRCFNR